MIRNGSGEDDGISVELAAPALEEWGVRTKEALGIDSARTLCEAVGSGLNRAKIAVTRRGGSGAFVRPALGPVIMPESIGAIPRVMEAGRVMCLIVEPDLVHEVSLILRALEPGTAQIAGVTHGLGAGVSPGMRDPKASTPEPFGSAALAAYDPLIRKFVRSEQSVGEWIGDLVDQLDGSIVDAQGSPIWQFPASALRRHYHRWAYITLSVDEDPALLSVRVAPAEDVSELALLVRATALRGAVVTAVALTCGDRTRQISRG